MHRKNLCFTIKGTFERYQSFRLWFYKENHGLAVDRASDLKMKKRNLFKELLKAITLKHVFQRNEEKFHRPEHVQKQSFLILTHIKVEHIEKMP